MRFIRLSCLLVLPSSVALAEPPGKLDASVALGGHIFSSQTELGVGDRMEEPGALSSGTIGGRIALAVASRIAIEGELMIIPTQDDVLGDAATVYGARAHVRIDLLTGKLRPFVVAGTGMHVVRGGAPQIDDDVDPSFHWGGGVRYAINQKWDLRIDVRHLIVPDRTTQGATSDFEATAGIGIKLGGKPAPKPQPVIVVKQPDPPPPPPPPVDPDPDKDGILGDADRCPLEAETINGYKDDDGCPDALIKEIEGIGFEPDSARIDAASQPILEKAYKLLVEYSALRVEISGHTSSEGIADRNLELSKWRANAVKTWLVKRGIAENRIETIGFGSKMPLVENDTEAGRILNRRIEFRILPAEGK